MLRDLRMVARSKGPPLHRKQALRRQGRRHLGGLPGLPCQALRDRHVLQMATVATAVGLNANFTRFHSSYTQRNAMEESLNQLNTVMETAAQHGAVFPEDLKKAIAEAKTPHYRIGVVGRFQVGKTTLTNRVFLKKPLLREGEGLCTTAVPTEVGYGPTEAMILEKDGRTTTFAPPTTEDITNATTATTEEERLKLAQSITRLRIETPNEHLRPYTILDTPGIDDPNQALLDLTTYRALPQCDLVLLVAEARQLSQIDIDFLTNSIFKTGLTKAMVLLSYNREATRLAAAARGTVLDTVRAQLANIGAGDIPVRMVCYDGEAPDILDTPEKVEAEILGFLAREVTEGRLRRLRAQVAKILIGRISEMRMLGELATRSRAEIEEANRRRELEEIELERQLAHIRGRMTRDLRSVTERLAGHVAERCDELMEKLLPNAGDLTEKELRAEIDGLYAELLDSARTDCEAVAQTHMSAVDALLDRLSVGLDSAEAEAASNLPHPEGETAKPVPTLFRDIGDLGKKMREIGLDQVVIDRIPNESIKIILTVIIEALPTILGFFRSRMAAQELEKRLGEVKTALTQAITDFVERFRQSVAQTIESRTQEEREKLQKVFQQALDDQEDDPVAIAKEVEALEPLLVQLTK